MTLLFTLSLIPHFPNGAFLKNVCVCVSVAQMRVPSSPNQSANPSTPWEAEPVAEESGAVEDANAENLYLMGKCLPLVMVL